MPWIWNDQTYWDRAKVSNKGFFKLFLPMWFVIFIIVGIVWFKELPLFAYFAISFSTVATILSFFDIFYRSPHVNIPDTYSHWAKMTLRFVNFLIAIVVLVWFLNHYAII